MDGMKYLFNARTEECGTGAVRPTVTRKNIVSAHSSRIPQKGEMDAMRPVYLFYCLFGRCVLLFVGEQTR